ncbi:methyltransferase domain-containing protein [Solirubrobacter ginsenosidimutans]|uniref:Arsenite methyltransferase n=1 Tax=Solirubrobacter ginsenosidimutans TaxID=490573 RepID=A0A9X3S044_9ACTN|nr:methyltransferase domain-containing protein [Solirubrobacter ginsenosidimutans]MDA0160919.1 methyltransferase domain-containing protein [Solirubrobacter ginsenosidimutans]
MSTALFDTAALRDEIRAMYRDVARDPGGDYHFEIGRPLALRLGYPPEWLDAIPSEALDSFAGVGHFLDLAGIQPGASVLDLGSGSGTDSFAAAHLAGTGGHVVGVDMTDAQLAKARRNAPHNVEFVEGLIESPPVEGGSIDVVISNGVINLAPDKRAVFDAAAWALRPGGRLALADIVSELHLAERTRGNVSLWAACIAGAVPLTPYLEAIEAAGLRVQTVRTNPAYQFLSPRAQRAVERYGVTSVSVLAIKP